MPPDLASTFTLIVPTRDRTATLEHLLRYLERMRTAFQVLVLDSSEASGFCKSASTISGLDLDARHLRFDPDIAPFEKFWRGSLEVRTELCALCGDDDVVLVESLDPIADYLLTHPDYAVGQGDYFGFYHGRSISLSSIIHSGPSIDEAQPLERLRSFFGCYRAITYGLYRSSVLQRSLGRAQGVDSILGQELLSGALAAAAGKIAHLPVLYYGRSLGASGSYEHWHPLEWLVDSPEGLFTGYVRYREILVDSLTTEYGGGLRTSEARRFIDYLHLGYLVDHVRRDQLDYLVKQFLAGANQKDTLDGLWARLEPSGSRVLDSARRSRLLRKLRDRWLPELGLRGVLSLLPERRAARVESTTATGTPRRYHLSREFLGEETDGTQGRNREEVRAALRQLDNYG